MRTSTPMRAHHDAAETPPSNGAVGSVGPRSLRVLGSRVDATSYPDAAARILAWARAGDSRSVCVASVNNVMVGRADAAFRAVTNGADLVTADGMPLVWALRWLGIPGATRVRGTDLMVEVLGRAAEEGIAVGLYGGDPEVLSSLVPRLRERWPNLQVPYVHSPPFRALTAPEDEAIVDAIAASGARILFVALGCPKQETWMAAHRGRIPAVMVGVGAAFDFLAGTKRQAPVALQRAGLEWLFRLLSEPRRLWRRYLTQNPAFLALLALQIFRSRMGRGPNPRRRDER